MRVQSWCIIGLAAMIFVASIGYALRPSNLRALDQTPVSAPERLETHICNDNSCTGPSE